MGKDGVKARDVLISVFDSFVGEKDRGKLNKFFLPFLFTASYVVERVVHKFVSRSD